LLNDVRVNKPMEILINMCSPQPYIYQQSTFVKLLTLATGTLADQSQGRRAGTTDK
jgi:hypothetical protein